MRQPTQAEADLRLLEAHPELSTANVMQLRYTSPVDPAGAPPSK